MAQISVNPKLNIVSQSHNLRYFVLIETGYEEDFSYRLGSNYDSFIQGYKNSASLVRIEDYIKTGYESIVNTILGFAKHRQIYRFSEGFYNGNYTHPIFVSYSNTPESIDSIIQQARDLNYCHIWGDNPIEKRTDHMIDNKTWLIHLKLEAESG